MMYKALVINLDKDTERLGFMKEQLDRQGIEFERIPGVNGREYIERFGVAGEGEYDERLAVEQGKFNAPLGPGNLGCALSHKRCYQRFLSDWGNGTDYCLIFEDDALLSPKFKAIAENEMRKNLERDPAHRWNFLQFDYPGVNVNLLYHYRSQIRLFGISSNKIKRLPFLLLGPWALILENFMKWFLGAFFPGSYPVFMRVPANLGAYIVDRAVAEKLVERNAMIINGSDVNTDVVYQENKKNFSFHIYYPKIVSQNNVSYASSSDKINSGKF